jgi:hypothetical protein
MQEKVGKRSRRRKMKEPRVSENFPLFEKKIGGFLTLSEDVLKS